MIDLDELERLARNASPGEWVAGQAPMTVVPLGEVWACVGPSIGSTESYAGTGPVDNPNSIADALFIASANPITVLELIAELRRLTS